MRPHLIAPLMLLVGALAPSPAGAQAGVESGVRLYEQKQYPAAKAALLPAGKSNAVAAYHLGRIAFEERDYPAAADWFEQAVKLDAGSSLYYTWLGRAYGRQAQRASKLRQPFLAKKTKAAWERAIALDPDNLDARSDLIEYYLQAPGVMGGSPEKAREQAREIRRRDPLRGALEAADVAERTKDTAGAEREYRALLASFPDSAVGYLRLALFYQQAQRYDDALAVLDQRLQRRPDDPSALYQVGRTGALSGMHLERAEQALLRYIAAPPTDAGTAGAPSLAGAHYRLGMVYQHQGKREQARREYETALRLNPEMRDARAALEKLQ